MRELFRAEPFLLLGVIAVLGFYFGRGARKLRLPSLIGFMLLGVLLGPSGAGFFFEGNLASLSFVTELALGFVAFSIGAELNLASLRRLGRGIAAVILGESLAAFFIVTLAVYALSRSWPLALLFGAVAPASAPAGTVAVIQEYRAKGTLTKALYAVVGFDDGLAILIFGFAAALAKNVMTGSLLGTAGDLGSVLAAMRGPAIEIVSSMGVGAALGFVYCLLVRPLRERRDMLVMAFGVILAAAGISLYFHMSLILTNMAAGFVLANTRREEFVRRATDPLRDVMPLLFILFFCLAGAHLRVSELPKLGAIGVVYILARSGGLILGSRLGASLGRVEDKIRRWIGLGILSQAGVAIGLSLIAASELREMAGTPAIAAAVSRYSSAHPSLAPVLYDPVAIGAALLTVVTATSIVFEIVGPVLTKVALARAGEIDRDDSQP